jgi:hypothetical protein
MPSAEQILSGLAEISREWRWLAVAWHLVLASFLLVLAVGWRPSRRWMGLLVSMLPASVSFTAWAQDNPFNGMVFALVAVVLACVSLGMSREPVKIAPLWRAVSGAILIGFGWIYPHFLEMDFLAAYLYAAPLGIIPCPSLSVAAGVALLLDLAETPAWSLVLALSGLLYGIIGAFLLGVWIDLVLLAGALTLTSAALVHLASRSAGRQASA